MFGYVRPRKDQLKICDYDRYRAAYCGLCRSLGKNFGFAYRFFVNYDMTFLYFLLSSNSPECGRGKCCCPANPICRKQCYEFDSVLAEVSAMDVILCHWKLSDAIQDSNAFKSILFRAARLITKRGYLKAAKANPAFDALAESQLSALSRLEQGECSSIDRTADTFAGLLKGCAAGIAEDEIRRPTEQLLYHVGRFIYLADALDDLAEDCKKGNYNPLRYRFSTKNGKLSAEDLTEFKQTLEQSISLAGAALELLPLKSAGDILKNTIYLGLPTVLKAVSEGTFHSKDKI